MVLGPLTLHNFGKLILWELLHPVIILAKHFIVDVSQGSDYASDFEYEYFEYFEYTGVTRVVNMPGFWIYFWFWIWHGSEHITVLNMPRLQRVRNMPEYVWIIPGYAWLYLNVPKSAWMAFALHLFIVIPYISCFLEE